MTDNARKVAGDLAMMDAINNGCRKGRQRSRRHRRSRRSLNPCVPPPCHATTVGLRDPAVCSRSLNQSQAGNYILQRWQRRGSFHHQCVGSGL